MPTRSRFARLRPCAGLIATATKSCLALCQFLAFLFYRREIVIRFDRVLVLLSVTALLNIAVDALSRTVRARLRLGTRVAVAAP